MINNGSNESHQTLYTDFSRSLYTQSCRNDRKRKSVHGKFYQDFFSFAYNRTSKFFGISAFLVPFIMCGETCDDAKLVDRKVDAAFSYCCTICEGGREGGRSQMLLADISTKVLDRYGR